MKTSLAAFAVADWQLDAIQSAAQSTQPCAVAERNKVRVRIGVPSRTVSIARKAQPAPYVLLVSNWLQMIETNAMRHATNMIGLESVRYCADKPLIPPRMSRNLFPLIGKVAAIVGTDSSLPQPAAIGNEYICPPALVGRTSGSMPLHMQRTPVTLPTAIVRLAPSLRFPWPRAPFNRTRPTNWAGWLRWLTMSPDA